MAFMETRVDPIGAALNAIKVLRSNVGHIFETLGSGLRADHGEEGKETKFLLELQDLLNTVNANLRDVETSVASLTPPPPGFFSLGNSAYLNQECTQERQALYGQLVLSYKWTDKIREYSTRAVSLLSQNSLKRSYISSSNKRRRTQTSSHNVPPQTVDSVVATIDRLFSDMTVNISRPFATNAVLQITLGRVLKAVVAFKGLMIEWVVVRGYMESMDLWTESRHKVFRKVTENSHAAMLHFYSPTLPELAVRSFMSEVGGWLFYGNNLKFRQKFCLHDKRMCENKWEGVLNSRILANYLKEMCKHFSPPYREASLRLNRQKAELSTNIIFVLTQIKRLITEGKMDEETFKNEFKKVKDLSVLHVEILWYLEVTKIMTIMEFIQFHESNNHGKVIEYIAGQFFESMLEQRRNPLEVRKQMLLFCFRTILECSRHDTGNRNSFYHVQMNLIITNLKQVYGERHIERHLDVLQLIDFLNKFDPDLIKKFFQDIFLGLLEGPPESLKSVIKKQEKIKTHVKDKKVFQFFLAVAKYCDFGFMMELLEEFLLKCSREIDWNHMFCFITFVGVQYKDGWSSIKSLTGVIIKMAFQNLNEKLLSHAFLTARQGCFEKGNNSFPSYVQWFASTFSTESKRLVNSEKICYFFFNFLTEILPYDSSFYLKVHINRPPWVPADCHPILHDYIEIVKAQLSDLNVSTELGICENTTSRGAAEFDVETVLKHFERTNDILHSVFQASMFCKEYYEKKFLVELLSKFQGKKSVRHKFITKLHSLGKVPNSLFKAYKTLEKKNNV